MPHNLEGEFTETSEKDEEEMKKLIIAMAFFAQISEAYVQFVPNEELVGISEYIVIAEMQNSSNTGKTIQWGDVSANVIKNKLKVVESIKGSWALDKPLFLNTFKFNGWMEDNIELPSKGSKVLLFLKQNEKDELKPVNGIQGVWWIDSDGKPRYGTIKEIREIVQKQADKVEESCSSKAFTSLLDTAETQTQKGKYSKALESYRKAYSICPMKDLEEQMAWLMGEVGEEENNETFKD